MAPKKDFAKLVDEGEQLAEKEFATKVSTLTTFTNKEIIDAMNETTISKSDLARILQILQDNTSSNEQKAKNIRNIGKGVELVTALLKKLI
jgi:hypothetical protein